MNPNVGSEKHLQEGTIQTVAHNLTSESAIQATQNVIQSNIHSVQTLISSHTQLMGKSVSLDLSPKISIRKPGMPATIASAVDSSKITATICPLGSTVRIIPPATMLQPAQQTQQIVTGVNPTYHVPRGPAAVANISAPRAANATPIVRSSTSHSAHVSRPGINSTVSNPQWQTKTSTVYTQPRYPIPSVSRVVPRAPAAVYSGPPPRLVTPVPGRPVQATVLTGVSGAPPRLIAPVLQSSSNIPRLNVTPTKPAVVPPQASNIAQNPQASRIPTIQQNQTSKPQNSITFSNRVPAPVISSANKIVTVASIQPPPITRQLPINTVPGASTANLSRIVLTPPQIQQQATTTRVVQTVSSLSNFAAVPRPVTTTTAAATAVVRPAQPGPTSVARIASMPQHPLPLTSVTRTLVAPVKVVQTSMQIKPATAVQQVVPKTTIVSAATSSTVNASSIPGQYLQPPNTFYSFDPPGNYSQFRQSAVQPMRLLVETAYEESHNKTNSSPRPSILRKREHDSSPAKAGVVKNLVPVLACMSVTNPSAPPGNSPPGSPTGEQDGGGCQSSGSTTVSATSSPGLEEPEQSCIPMNPNVEMSPRKKPRKQQLTGVEFTESRGTDEEMQFIVEERIKKEVSEEPREKSAYERNLFAFGSQEDKKAPSPMQQPTSVPLRTKPVPCLVGSSWRNKYGDNLRHYKRPSDVRPREERKLTVAELAQQKHVLQKLNGWKLYHLTTQMDDLSELERQVHEKLKSTLTMLESQQPVKSRQDDGLERVNELMKGNMQRSILISEGMTEARTQLVAIFQHKSHVTEILQRCGNKRSQKKRDK